MECSCNHCQQACKSKPGWFEPGQIELVAEQMKISVQELFDKHLAVDYWTGVNPIFILSPATKSNIAGEMDRSL